MTLFVSKPQHVEAVQWTGDNVHEMQAFAGEKVRLPSMHMLNLLAGKDGAQKWVPVPVGHWLVHQPGDLSDIWPVDPDYFAGKYGPADSPALNIVCREGERERRQLQFLEIMADGGAITVNGMPWREVFEKINAVVSDPV